MSKKPGPIRIKGIKCPISSDLSKMVLETLGQKSPPPQKKVLDNKPEKNQNLTLEYVTSA